MEAILERHPKIKFIFAHMYFMSAQLPRLSALLDAYPNMMVDITPGLEIYINLSKKDYIEPRTEKVIIEEEKSWIDELKEEINNIF